MKLATILTPSRIVLPLSAGSKKTAITELVDCLDQDGQLADRDQVLSSILAREATRSTGIGQGLAVPHGKSPGCRALTMAIGRCAQPIEFASADGKPCSFIVLLASPVDKTGPHIQALAAVSRLWLNERFRAAAMNAGQADQLLSLIREYEG